jgi:hypothetical protein
MPSMLVFVPSDLTDKTKKSLNMKTGMSIVMVAD